MKRLLIGLLIAAGLVAGAAAVTAWLAWQRLQRPFGDPAAEHIFDVPEGSSAQLILARLEAEGILADRRLARLYLIHGMGDPALRAGEYHFSGPLSTVQVLERLVHGEVLRHSITVVEGLFLEQTATVLAASELAEEEALLAAMRDPAGIRDLDPQAEDLEGYLFPDTYHFTRGMSAEAMVAAMVGNFRRRLEQESLGVGDLRALVTLASIVEKEAAVDAERPAIAGVYRNRLDQGIALYADPTVIFGLRRAGRWDGNLTREGLRFDTPYNTYLHAGLPPGPICSPGLASLQAAARPADVPYLYFVSRNDGSHVFASTLSEHNRNVARWQRAYWRQRWQAAAAGESAESAPPAAAETPADDDAARQP